MFLPQTKTNKKDEYKMKYKNKISNVQPNQFDAYFGQIKTATQKARGTKLYLLGTTLISAAR
jgi:GTPase